MESTVRALFEQIIGFLFPPQAACLICGHESEDSNLCQNCRGSMINKKLSFCPVCGRFQPNNRPQKPGPCQECCAKPPDFFKARSVGPYGGLLKDAVYKYKYGGCRSLSEPLGLMMAGVFVGEPGFNDAEALIPVPLNREKLLVRGFNQAELLSRKIGRVLNLPVHNCLDRVRPTPRQSKLTREARQDNLHGAFQLNAKAEYNKVILVDDILTTGATANECAAVLMRAGVKSVGVLTLASVILEKADYDFWQGR